MHHISMSILARHTKASLWSIGILRVYIHCLIACE